MDKTKSPEAHEGGTAPKIQCVYSIYSKESDDQSSCILLFCNSNKSTAQHARKRRVGVPHLELGMWRVGCAGYAVSSCCSVILLDSLPGTHALLSKQGASKRTDAALPRRLIRTRVDYLDSCMCCCVRLKLPWPLSCRVNAVQIPC